MAATNFRLRNGGGSSFVLNPAGAAPTTVATGDGNTAPYTPFRGAPTGGTTDSAGRAADKATRLAAPRTSLTNMFTSPGNQSLSRDATVPNSVRPVDNTQKLADASKAAAPAQTPAGPAAPPAPGGGSESGPGILESWFNQRANGTDPAFEYMSDRGHKSINNEFAARGGYNSGAAEQGLRDFDANLTSQRMGQLDSLAGGASGEHQGRLNSMFSQGLGLANGQAGISGMYDTSAGNAMNSGNVASIQLALDRAGVDSKTSQGILNAIFGGLGLLT